MIPNETYFIFGLLPLEVLDAAEVLGQKLQFEMALPAFTEAA